MGKAKFSVRASTSTTNATVYYNISLSKKERLTGKTNVSVNPDYWDKEEQLINIKKTISKKKATADNTKLLEFSEWINDKLVELKSKPNIASVKQELKKQVEVYSGRVKLFETRVAPTLFEYFDEFERSLKLRENSSSSLVTYNKLKELLLDFQHKQDTTLSFESGPTGGIILKSATGATIKINDLGIAIDNGKGATIELIGQSVDINKGEMKIE